MFWGESGGVDETYSVTRDVFLGGSCGESPLWRSEVAIPLLRVHGLSFFNPQVRHCERRYAPSTARQLGCGDRDLVLVDTVIVIGVG